LAELGPCSEHRYSFVNVRRAGSWGERSDGVDFGHNEVVITGGDLPDEEPTQRAEWG
jgi:hypothetical protein